MSPGVHGWFGVPACGVLGDVELFDYFTTGDLFVPIEMEQIYAQEVHDNGLGDLLVQRAIRDVGPGSFTGDELQAVYADLFNWVENGAVPSGDDVIGDISSPTLGCEFTSPSGRTG